MKYKIYRFIFQEGVHFGNKSLIDGMFTMYADTLFSAICIETLNMFGEEKLLQLLDWTKNDKLLFSDGLPFIDKDFYIPKPIKKIDNNNTDKNSDQSTKKLFKKLNYIPMNELNNYLNGTLDPKKQNSKFDELGSYSLSQKVALSYNEKPEPYSVGSYRFNDKNGIYFIVGTENDEIYDFIEDILVNHLSYSGVGGKRTSGYGRFDVKVSDLDEDFKKKLECDSKFYMTLSTSMCRDNELDEILEGANYQLIKRGGFVQSETYSKNLLKKRDFYSFKSGSVFTKRFTGDIFDVSQDGSHPVYRYAKPIMLGVD